MRFARHLLLCWLIMLLPLNGSASVAAQHCPEHGAAASIIATPGHALRHAGHADHDGMFMSGDEHRSPAAHGQAGAGTSGIAHCSCALKDHCASGGYGAALAMLPHMPMPIGLSPAVVRAPRLTTSVCITPHARLLRPPIV